MSATNSFNCLFVKRLANLFHVFIPLSRLSLHVQHERLYTHPLILVLLILLNEIGLQFVIYFVGLLPARYYDQLGRTSDKRDYPGVRLLLLRSFLLIGLNALLKTLSDFLSSLLYVKWRTRLVLYLHSCYFTKKNYYHLLNGTQQHRTQDTTSMPVYPNHSVQT